MPTKLNCCEIYIVDNPKASLPNYQPIRLGDGSPLELRIQATPPATAPANWLPVRADRPFVLNARLYWPASTALQGQWQMPAPERMAEP